MNTAESDPSTWFAHEIQPHEPALRRFFFSHFPELRDIDDLVQETYVRVLRANHRHRIDDPRAYLFATAQSAAVDNYRRQKIFLARNLAEIDVESVTEDGPDAAETASGDQESEVLADAINALPERCRLVMQLRWFDGLSYREIALRLGVSEKTVNAQLALALLRCRRYFCTHGLFD